MRIVRDIDINLSLALEARFDFLRHLSCGRSEERLDVYAQPGTGSETSCVQLRLQAQSRGDLVSSFLLSTLVLSASILEVRSACWRGSRRLAWTHSARFELLRV